MWPVACDSDSDEAKELELLDIDMPSLPPYDVNNVEKGNYYMGTGLSDSSD